MGGNVAGFGNKSDASTLPKVEYNDTRWELEVFGGGSRLTLWHTIDRRFISTGAAGWQMLSMFWITFSAELPSTASSALRR